MLFITFNAVYNVQCCLGFVPRYLEYLLDRCGPPHQCWRFGTSQMNPNRKWVPKVADPPPVEVESSSKPKSTFGRVSFGGQVVTHGQKNVFLSRGRGVIFGPHQDFFEKKFPDR